MSYFTFKEALTSNAQELDNTELSITHVRQDNTKLSNIKAGIRSQVFDPAKRSMDEYLQKRMDYLNSLETETTPDGDIRFEWRSQLTHDTVWGSLCATDVYADPDERSSNLSNWTLERWRLYDYDDNRSSSSDFWFLCGEWTGEKETFTDITEESITQSGLNTKYTPADFTQYADDYLTGMQWIYATPDFEYQGQTWHHQAGSFGLNYRIDNNTIAVSALDYVRSHQEKLKDLNTRH